MLWALGLGGVLLIIFDARKKPSAIDRTSQKEFKILSPKYISEAVSLYLFIISRLFSSISQPDSSKVASTKYVPREYLFFVNFLSSQ
jgi:hypothetical protein